jgi:hypothetical protein
MSAARLLAILLILGILGLTHGPVRAELVAAEDACQQAASKQSGTFVGKKIKCLVACDKQALKGKVPAADCVPPFAGAALACVTTAETKALDGIAKKCTLDCPECYTAGDCVAHAAALVADVEAQIDFVVPFVACDDAASPDGLTQDEAKVRRKVAQVVGKFVRLSEKCLAKCRKAAAAGKIAPETCVYANVTYQPTFDCLVKVADKALDFLEDPALDAPECLAPSLGFALPVASGLIEEFDPRLFCGSPSGAFVE